ncbi:MAG: CapA family protein [Lachnospiraceae bacterium]|nr:CapA family protein [Lachnospiraceae bacterium]
MKKKFNIDDYEYKSPSYMLRMDNKYIVDEESYRKESRYYYDKEEEIFRSKEGKKDKISLLFAGDLLCQENMLTSYCVGGRRHDFTLCFDYIRPLLKSADFAAGNLETPISHTAPYRGDIITHEGPFYCNAPLSYLSALKYAGFDMLTTENNHALDAGARGLYETIINTKKYDFIQTGTFIEKGDKFVIVDICGFKIGFTAFGRTYNLMQKNLTKKGRITLLNTFSENRAQTVYNAMKEKGAEYTICFPHWGKEFSTEIVDKQRNAADILTKIGFDLVAGSHPHLIQQFEYMNKKPVVFSLGNIMTHLNVNERWMDTQYPMLCHLELIRKDEKIIPNIDFIPCRILKGFHNIPFTVVPYNNNLGLSQEFFDELKDTPSAVARMLHLDKEKLNINYPIRKEELDIMKKAEGEQKNRVVQIAGIQAIAEKPIFDKEKVKEDFLKKGFLKKNPEEYWVGPGGIYKIYREHAEFVNLASSTAILRMYHTVENLPVTKVSNFIRKDNNIRVIYLSKYTEEVAEKAFQHFHNLESVRFYSELKKIGKKAFANCPKLTGLVFPKSLEVIGDKAFADCGCLYSAKIPSTVKEIGKNTFMGCKNLVIYCEEGSYVDLYAKSNHIAVKYMPL